MIACAAVREALAQGTSSDDADGHLAGCGRCQETARHYAALRRFYSLEAAGEQPADFDLRVLSRIAGLPAGRRRRVSPSLLVVLLVAVVATLLAVALSRARARGTSPGTAVRLAVRPLPTATAAAVEAPAAPSAADQAEQARAASRPDLELLRWSELLAALDVFFPDVYGPAPPVSPAAPSLSDEQLWERVAAWRRLPPAERRRLEELEARFRALPPERQQTLRERWESLSAWTPGERAGLRRLAARLAELGARRLGRLATDLRALRRDVGPRRAARWRGLAFARGLTGQELAAGERLLEGR